MERSDFDDDEQYPVAPVPAHERVWRHPSEIGSAQWTLSEPPLAMGRGLFVGTSVLGGLLALAVVWAMLPTSNSSVAVVSSTLAFTPAATTRPAPPLATLAALRSTASADAATTTEIEPRHPDTSTSVALPPSSLATRPEPAPSTVVLPTILYGSPIGVAALPVAVGLSEGSLIITTAHAAANRSTLAVSIEGKRVNAHVVLVDADSGVAVIAVDESPSVWYAIAETSPSIGDIVRVIGSKETEAQVVLAADGGMTLSTWGDDEVEGAMVLDQDGNLIGMCTHSDAGSSLVIVAQLSGIRPKPPAHDPAWLGIGLSVSPDTSDVTVYSVETGSPAASAGLVPGDVLIAVGGIAVISAEQVSKWLTDTSPGAAVEVRLRRADGTEVMVSMITATRPPSI